MPRLRVALVVVVALLVATVLTHVPSQADEATKSALPINGKADPKFARFDEAMTTLLEKHKLPGATLAVAKDGVRVYSRGYGYADREAKQPMRPDTLLRISSIAKPITAVAVLQLIERGKLRLDDKVMDVLKLRAPAKGFDPRWKKVTIRHLLEHRGGWDSEKSNDPMFISPLIVREMGGNHPAMPWTIIRYMLKQEFDFEPGERFAYANFGYCLLGRVIEKVTGKFYEPAVKENVLAPLGIKRMRLGKTLYPDRAKDEGRYYSATKSVAVMGPFVGRQVAAPYGGFCLEAMDAHGGWIASAEELCDFACGVTNPDRCKILKPESVRRYSSGQRAKRRAVYYGKGWVVRPFGSDKFERLARRHDRGVVVPARPPGRRGDVCRPVQQPREGQEAGTGRGNRAAAAPRRQRRLQRQVNQAGL
ncbi:MAG: serine hydrolase domain-containing protein [Gemmataceae bacterium]